MATDSMENYNLSNQGEAAARGVLDRDERVMKLWTPLHARVEEGYDFVPKSPAFCGLSWMVKHFASMVLYPFNKLLFDVKFEGQEKLKGLTGKGYVSVSNHVHMLDCVMVSHALSDCMLRYPTIVENLEIPMVRWLVRILGGVPIPKNTKAFAEFEQALSAVIRGGGGVHFFAEGVLIPYYRGVRPFRRGAFRLAVEESVPIVPIAITFREPDGLLRGLKRKQAVTVTVLDPIFPSEGGRDESSELMARCEKAIAARCAQ